jgi:hypothetical protein
MIPSMPMIPGQPGKHPISRYDADGMVCQAEGVTAARHAQQSYPQHMFVRPAGALRAHLLSLAV